MRFFLFCIVLLICSPFPVAAQDFVDPAQVNIGEIPESGTDRGGQIDNGNATNAAQSRGVLNPYDPKYRPMQYYKREGNAILPSSLGVQFVRPADLKQDEIVLRLSQPMVITGCALVALPQPKIEMHAPIMRILVEEPVVEVVKDTRKPEYQCDTKNKLASVDIRWKLKPLKDQGIQTVYFISDFGQDKYTLDMQDRVVYLTPKTSTLFKPYTHVSGRDPLTHYILPKNTMMVDAPGLMDKPPFNGVKRDRVFALEQFAQRRGLTPLTEILPEFEQRREPPFYAVDKMGTIYDTLNANAYEPVGFLRESELWHGGNGPYDKQKRIEVVAKRPGFYE